MDQNTILFLFTVINGLIAVSNFLGKKTKDGQESGQEIGIIITNLDNVKETINEVKEDVKYLKKKDGSFVEQLTKLEGSCEEAHKRIDRLENTIKELHMKDNPHIG